MIDVFDLAVVGVVLAIVFGLPYMAKRGRRRS